MTEPLPDLLKPERFDSDQVHAVIPQLFIGLGGTGGRIVKRLYERMSHNPAWRQYQADSTEFLVVDTNIDDLDDYPPNGKIQTVCTKRAGQHEELKRLIMDKDPLLFQWMPKDYVPRGSNLGAGQIRLESRVAFHLNSDVIARKIDQLIDSITDVGNVYRSSEHSTIRVFIFCTLAGGTGSGCFLPMAYLLRERLCARGLTPILQGYLMTSKTVEQKVRPEIYPQIRANSYAALKELEHLHMVACHQKPIEFVYRSSTADGQVPEIQRPPLDWVVLIDEPISITLDDDEIWRAVADMAYLNITSPARANEDSARDNYTKFMRLENNPLVGERTRLSKGYSFWFGTAGASALICPRQELLYYCTLRFKAATIRQQFTLATDKSVDELLDMSKYDIDTQRELYNNAWLKTFKELAQQDYKRKEEEQDQLERGGMAKEKAETLAKKSLFYASRWHAVTGNWPASDEGKPVKKTKTDAFGRVIVDKAAAKSDFVEVHSDSLVEKVRAFLEDRIPDTNFVDATSMGVGAAAMQGKTAMGTIDDEARKAQRKWSELQETVDYLKGSVNETFDTLRSDAFDAIAERFLSLTLLEKYLGQWLETAEAELKGAEKNSLLGDSWRDTIKPIIEEASVRVVDTPLEHAKEILPVLMGGSDEYADMEALSSKVNAITAPMASDTAKHAHAQIRVDQLRAFHGFLKQRAKTYADLTLRSVQRAEELDAIAAKAKDMPLEDDKNYVQKVEVLNHHDGSVGRFWDWFWEDIAMAKVKSLLSDPKLLGGAISSAMAEEEQRVARETADGSVDADRILQQVEEGFAQTARQKMVDFIREKTELDDLLTIEAIYGTLEAADERPRHRIVKEALATLDDSKSAAYEGLRKKLSNYIAAKFRILTNLSAPLANFNESAFSATEFPYANLFIYVGSRRMLDSMERHFEDALTTVTRNFQLQEWPDPRTLILYRCIATTPIYAYPNVMELHMAYENLQKPGRKANELHIDGAWEAPDALLDLQIESRHNQEIVQWRTKNRWLIANLIRVGLLRLEKKGSRPHWVLKTEERTWPDADEDPAWFSSEQDAPDFYEKMHALLSGSFREVLEEDIRAKGKSLPRIAGRATSAIEAMTRRGRANEWPDQELLDELAQLAKHIENAL